MWITRIQHWISSMIDFFVHYKDHVTMWVKLVVIEGRYRSTSENAWKCLACELQWHPCWWPSGLLTQTNVAFAMWCYQSFVMRSEMVGMSKLHQTNEAGPRVIINWLVVSTPLKNKTYLKPPPSKFRICSIVAVVPPPMLLTNLSCHTSNQIAM